MPDKIIPNRAKDYRNRAEEARANAAATTDDKERAGLLQTADIWDRMASWEDRQHSKLSTETQAQA